MPRRQDSRFEPCCATQRPTAWRRKRLFFVASLAGSLLLCCGGKSESSSDDDASGDGVGGSGASGGSWSAGGGPGPQTGGENSGGVGPADGGGGHEMGGSETGGLGGEGGAKGGANGSGAGGFPEDGSGGGAPSDCDGIQVECNEPGEVICDDRGQEQLCGECLRLESTGEPCVRILRMDKENGFVCALRGERELLCEGGSVLWMDTPYYSIVLPQFPVVLGIGNDAFSAEAQGYCMINEGGEVLCHQTAAGPAPLGIDCTDVAIGSHVTCSVCEGSLRCTGVDVSEEGVQTVDASNSSVVWSTLSGELRVPEGFSVPEPGKFLDFSLSDHGDFCGVRDDGALVCRSNSGISETVHVAGDFVSLGANSNGLKCALGSDGTVSCFVFSGDALTPTFAPDGASFTQVVTGSQMGCALERRGVVTCWDTEGLISFDAPSFN